MRYLVGLFGVLFFGGLITIARLRRDMKEVARSLTIFASLMIAISLVSIASFHIRASGSLRNGEDHLVNSGDSNKQKPDIYYFMLDGYASEWSFNTVFQYDNSAFYKDLRKREFYVVSKSRSNYPNTTLSLPSMLNMDYDQNLISGERLSAETFNHRRLIQDNKVMTFLKSQGYKYVHAGSWWDPTYYNRNADININRGFMPEFVSTLYKSVALGPLDIQLFDTRKEQYNRLLYQLEELKKVPQMGEPTFVFAHFNLAPYVFREDGSFLPPEEHGEQLRLENLKKNYPRQLAYLNVRMLELIDVILAKSERPPVIILQSDHGSRILSGNIGDIETADELSPEDTKERLRNFTALYLPDGGSKLAYDTMSNVNTFRIVLSHYFGQNYPLLPDRSYITVPGKHYELFDVTGIAKYEK